MAAAYSVGFYAAKRPAPDLVHGELPDWMYKGTTPKITQLLRRHENESFNRRGYHDSCVDSNTINPDSVPVRLHNRTWNSSEGVEYLKKMESSHISNCMRVLFWIGLERCDNVREFIRYLRCHKYPWLESELRRRKENYCTS